MSVFVYFHHDVANDQHLEVGKLCNNSIQKQPQKSFQTVFYTYINQISLLYLSVQFIFITKCTKRLQIVCLNNSNIVKISG